MSRATKEPGSRRATEKGLSANRDEIRQLRVAIAGVMGTASPDAVPSPDPDWRARWHDLATLGVTSLCVPSDRGGAGLEVEAAAAVAAELGAALHGAPYAGTVAASHALAASDDPAAGALLAAIVAGDAVCAFGRWDGEVAPNVDGAPGADALVLVERGTHELLLFDDPAAWTATAPATTPFDVSRSCADVVVDPTRAHRLPADRVAAQLVGLLLAADALGGTERLLARTVAYAGERQAFGRPIGGFQAVQHRLADHAVRVRGMGLAVRDAARAIAAGAPDAARRTLVAEASVSGGALGVLHDLVQLTGAIGFTWEHGAHLAERRAHQDARLAGNPRRARAALAEIEGWTRAG